MQLDAIARPQYNVINAVNNDICIIFATPIKGRDIKNDRKI